MKTALIISPKDIEETLHTTLSQQLHEQCLRADLRYQELTPSERDRYILDVVEVLASDALSIAGDGRLAEWENGWGQNLKTFTETRNTDVLIPKYHGKHRLLHWKQNMIRPLVPDFDYQIHCLLIDWAVETFLANVSAIMEFGCGTAYHLLRARRYNPAARLVGLDWATASQKIIASIRAYEIDPNIVGHHFDFYHPDHGLEFLPNSGVLTVAALEQVGDRFGPFLEYILSKSPSICVHFEPIDELMDANNLIDRLSVLYCRKRNYLKGFLTALRQLQKAGKVRILKEQRTYTGSFFIEGHSLVVWTPV